MCSLNTSVVGGIFVEKDLIRVEHNIAYMEKQEKLAVTILLFILPIVGAAEAYRYYYNEIYYWDVVAILMLLILLSVNVWNRFFLGISIVVQFIIASSLIACYMLGSMIKGIESSASAPPTWQYGLLNFADLLGVMLILCHVAFITSHLMLRCHDFKVQQMRVKR